MNRAPRHNATAVQFQCNLCALYLNEESIWEHVFAKHKVQDKFRCLFCSYSGNKKDDLLRHQKDKHKFEQCFLPCPLCNFSSTIEEDIRSHIQNVHFTIQNFISFQTIDASKKRSRNDYICKYQDCRAICQNPYKLFSHYMHHFPKLTLYYKCSECEYGDKNTKISSLHQHLRDMHGIFDDACDRPYVEIQCQWCSYKTSHKEKFKQHISNANHNMLYYCPFKECSYESELFWSFTQHVTDKHLYEITCYYSCFVCDQRFPLLNSLIQHLRDKYGIEEACTVCNSYEENLADHIDNDHDELCVEYLNCCFCDDEFEDKIELVNHLTTEHSIIIPLEVREVVNI